MNAAPARPGRAAARPPVIRDPDKGLFRPGDDGGTVRAAARPPVIRDPDKELFGPGDAAP